MKGFDHHADLGTPAIGMRSPAIELDATLHVTAHGLAQSLRVVVEEGLGIASCPAASRTAVARMALRRPLPTPLPLSGSSATAASPTSIDRVAQGVIARRGIAAKPSRVVDDFLDKGRHEARPGQQRPELCSRVDDLVGEDGLKRAATQTLRDHEQPAARYALDQRSVGVRGASA